MKVQRQVEIENYIRLKKTVSLDELCEEFNVSKNTIRRDVNEILKKEGYNKVYGGVEFTRNYLLPFEKRNQRANEKKEQIAQLAAQIIQPDDIIFIDSGTTTQYIPDYLEQNTSLTVLTNSLNIINKMIHFPYVKLIIVGEIYKRETNSFVGMDKIDIINKYNIHKAFMAATAASIESGLTNSDNQEYVIKKTITEKASAAYALLDNEKFGKSALVTYSPLNGVDGIITNEKLPSDYQIYVEENNVKVIHPNK